MKKTKLQLLNTTTDEIIAEEVFVAESFFARSKGLLGRSDFKEHTALWIKDCPSVHTFFMQFSIDVIFVNKRMKVTRVLEGLKPWRFSKLFQFQNSSCFEFSANKISSKVKKGDQLHVCT